jgi:hypothetical protein
MIGNPGITGEGMRMVKHCVTTINLQRKGLASPLVAVWSHTAVDAKDAR